LGGDQPAAAGKREESLTEDERSAPSSAP
jgi:hypothetical protein